MEGAWPPAVVDHINRDKTDNRWGNLRHASRSQNQFNHTRHINNKSGVSGVAFDRNKRTWRAFITAFGKRRDARKRTFEEAVKQRKEWESALHGGFAPAA